MLPLTLPAVEQQSTHKAITFEAVIPIVIFSGCTWKDTKILHSFIPMEFHDIMLKFTICNDRNCFYFFFIILIN